jgi:hypothetical protein
MLTAIGIACLFTFSCAYFYFAGKTSGIRVGALGITQFYQRKGALKDKSNIVGYNSWDEGFKKIFENTLNITVKDK